LRSSRTLFGGLQQQDAEIDLKRILFEVPKWHVLLHRGHRELPRQSDTPRLVSDELFERLNAGELDALPSSEVTPLSRNGAVLSRHLRGAVSSPPTTTNVPARVSCERT
jgi:hypothetical protein